MPSEIQVSLRKDRSHGERRSEILQTLAAMLQEPDFDKVTTARLASSLNLSEAALYRHFSNKAAMYDALIDFIEEALADLFAQIRDAEAMSGTYKVRSMISVLLDFADANPGLVRSLSGQALTYENPKLTDRVRRLWASYELGLKQAFRTAIAARELPADFNASGRAAMVMSFVIGQWTRFALSGFRDRPNQIGPASFEVFYRP